ncbi:hypothetical protein CEXT_763721 [Caerostris extrusa]|uniref:Uncharacterized protein n=1 Tax=Caerostris extrusa TaxID=172846 RepID=A0AAV4WC35_CAEEX|nr:hypothetical protein CEXT_763721 [Caerostris extrusa]
MKATIENYNKIQFNTVNSLPDLDTSKTNRSIEGPYPLKKKRLPFHFQLKFPHTSLFSPIPKGIDHLPSSSSISAPRRHDAATTSGKTRNAVVCITSDRRLLRGIEYIRYLFVRAIYLTTQSPRVDIVLYIVSER